MPLTVLSMFVGFIALQAHQTQVIMPSVQTTQKELEGRSFIAYRDAVQSFVENNRSFTGSVPLHSLHISLPESLLNKVNNHIYDLSSNQKVIVCYADLFPGAVQAALEASHHDAAIGMVRGANWLSMANGAALQPLNTTIPDGNIVSVVQIRNRP